MAEWATPKTDWNGDSDENGNYIGDYFNAADYNRIKGNLTYLHDLAIEMYTWFSIESMGDDKDYTEYMYADEINTIENNLDTIIRKSFGGDYGTKQTYTANGPYIDFSELNRIESACLDLHLQLSSQYTGRRRLKFRLGEREVF